MTRLVNRAELADSMGVSPPTVDRWIKDGCPVARRGGRGTPWTFSLPDVVQWWGERKVAEAAGDVPDDEEALKLRKLAAETGKAELEFARAKEEVAPVREFERAMAAAFAEVRTNVMNVPQRVVAQLLGETNESAIKAVLRRELTRALQAAADAPLTLTEDAGGADDVLDGL